MIRFIKMLLMLLRIIPNRKLYFFKELPSEMQSKVRNEYGTKVAGIEMGFFLLTSDGKVVDKNFPWLQMYEVISIKKMLLLRLISIASIASILLSIGLIFIQNELPYLLISFMGIVIGISGIIISSLELYHTTVD